MQEFCLEYCKANEVRDRQEEHRILDAPAVGSVFPRTGDRGVEDGVRPSRDRAAPAERPHPAQVRGRDAEGDIYEAVLAAIAATGPRTGPPRTTTPRIDAGMSSPRSRRSATRSPASSIQLTEIAKKKIEGEPVVEFDESLDVIYISDPYFAYFLRWGTPAGATSPATS